MEDSFLAPQAFGAVEKWESWFWISTFPQPWILRFSGFCSVTRKPPELWECGNLAVFADFQGAVGRVGNLFLVSTRSIAPSFPQLSAGLLLHLPFTPPLSQPARNPLS